MTDALDVLKHVDPGDREHAAGIIALSPDGSDIAVDLFLSGTFDLQGPWIVSVKRSPHKVAAAGAVSEAFDSFLEHLAPSTSSDNASVLWRSVRARLAKESAAGPEVLAVCLLGAALTKWRNETVHTSAYYDYVLVDLQTMAPTEYLSWWTDDESPAVTNFGRALVRSLKGTTRWHGTVGPRPTHPLLVATHVQEPAFEAPPIDPDEQGEEDLLAKLHAPLTAAEIQDLKAHHKSSGSPPRKLPPRP